MPILFRFGILEAKVGPHLFVGLLVLWRIGRIEFASSVRALHHDVRRRIVGRKMVTATEGRGRWSNGRLVLICAPIRLVDLLLRYTPPPWGEPLSKKWAMRFQDGGEQRRGRRCCCCCSSCCHLLLLLLRGGCLNTTVVNTRKDRIRLQDGHFAGTFSKLFFRRHTFISINGGLGKNQRHCACFRPLISPKECRFKKQKNLFN